MSRFVGGRRSSLYIKQASAIKPHFVLGDELEALENPGLYQNKKKIKERAKGMKRKILTFIEDLKDTRKKCVEACGYTCQDTKLSHEGKIDQMNHNISVLKEWAADGSGKIIRELENKIEAINQEEAAAYKKKRESADYAARLNSTLELLKVSADRMKSEDVTMAVEQFADDPMAIAAISDVLGFKRAMLAPDDNRGKRQATLQRVIDNVKSSVSMLTDVKYQESGFPGSFVANDFNISLPALTMFDMAFVESLTDDCTVELEQEPLKEENPDFGFDKLHNPLMSQDFNNSGLK